jgi:hypothetical protein
MRKEIAPNIVTRKYMNFHVWIDTTEIVSFIVL